MGEGALRAAVLPGGRRAWWGFVPVAGFWVVGALWEPLLVKDHPDGAPFLDSSFRVC